MSPPERPQLLPGKETKNTFVFTVGRVYTAGFALKNFNNRPGPEGA